MELTLAPAVEIEYQHTDWICIMLITKGGYYERHYY
jgi:hypothetical protein